MRESCFPTRLVAWAGGRLPRPQPAKGRRGRLLLSLPPPTRTLASHPPVSLPIPFCLPRTRRFGCCRRSSSPASVIAVGSVPVVLGTLGFTSAGIAASSIAAKMMSAAAISNGGGVAAGSLVATLQSVGAAGLSTSSNILLASVGSAIGALLGGSKKKPPTPPPAESEDEEDQPEEKDS
ncbi:hypothetical protein MC885_008392 [Smutsia gigantea]|nr:hypothetical protein MC885_008392 [Smutsia gigantea]